jgi:hypothetical protein
MGTLSDLVFAAMPVHIISSLNWPVTERVLVIVLMGFGAIAAVAGVMKSTISALGTLAMPFSGTGFHYSGGIEWKR